MIQTLKIISVRCISLSLRSKTRRRATLLLPTWICSCQSVGTVNFALPFTTNVTISISILQTFRFSVATSHLRPPIDDVFISQLIRYARACSSYECFILRAVRLSNKLLGQGYVKEHLKSSAKEVSTVCTGISPNNMRPPLPNETRHSGWWPYTVTPSIDRTLHQFLTFTDLDLITEFDFYLIMHGFYRTFATGAACWSCSLGLACVLMSRPIFPELVLFPDFWVSNTPRYFSFTSRLYQRYYDK